jgi:group I intron endonuclease
MFDVYLIDNEVNSKVYVGVTSIGLRERMYCHNGCANSDSTYPLYVDMKLYGKDKFHIHRLCTTDSENERDILEQFFIKHYNCMYPNGYNLTGGGVKNIKTPIWMINSEQYKLRGSKISSSLKGVSKSSTHKKHLSESRMGRFTGADNPFYGKHHSDETKKLIASRNSKHTVYMLDKDTDTVIMTFCNINDASRYITENGFSTAKVATCATRIHLVATSENKNCTAYGFKWRFDKV